MGDGTLNKTIRFLALLSYAVPTRLRTLNGEIGSRKSEKRALQLDPQDADAWNNLGALLARGGQTAAARSAFEPALNIQPDHAQAKANLARLSSHN
jgi:Tfp pilus assembly protein PilF